MNAREIDKMTIKKLREECLKIEKLTGVHGMTKDRLIKELKMFHNIPFEVSKKAKVDVKGIRKQLDGIRIERDKAREENNIQRYNYLKKRISKLKKQTRRIYR